MAENITLADLANLQNETTAVNAINSNNAILETAFTDVLSRSGTSPNQMNAVLDMNSFPIINLPAPVSVSSPARMIDVTSNPTITVPPVGTSGATVPLLNGNNTFSGTNVFTAGITGVTNGSNAASGKIGEYLTNTGGSTSLTAATLANAVSLSLTAGDWDVWGVISFLPASSTVVNVLLAGLSQNSASLSGTPFQHQMSYANAGTVLGNNPITLTISSARYNLSSTSTIFLVCEAFFSVSTMTTNASAIYARRRN